MALDGWRFAEAVVRPALGRLCVRLRRRGARRRSAVKSARDLVRVEEPVTPPAFEQEPHRRLHDRRRSAERARRRAIEGVVEIVAPPVEPARGRGGVEHALARERLRLPPELREPLRRVPSRVQQHVGEHVPHLPRARSGSGGGSGPPAPSRCARAPRFTARAKRAASDFMPRPSASGPFASTITCA